MTGWKGVRVWGLTYAGNKQGQTQGIEKDTKGKNTVGKVRSLVVVGLHAESNTMSWSERRKLKFKMLRLRAGGHRKLCQATLARVTTAARPISPNVKRLLK